MNIYVLRQQVEDNFKKKISDLEEDKKKQLEAIDIVLKLSIVTPQPEKGQLSTNVERLDPLTTALGVSTGGMSRTDITRSAADMIRSAFESLKIGDLFTRASLRDIVCRKFPNSVVNHVASYSSTLRLLEARGCVSISSKREGSTHTKYKKTADYIEVQLQKKDANKEHSDTLISDLGITACYLMGADMIRYAFGSIEIGGSFTIPSLRNIICLKFPGAIVSHGSFSSTLRILKKGKYIAILKKGKGQKPSIYKKRADHTEVQLRRKPARQARQLSRLEERRL